MSVLGKPGRRSTENSKFLSAILTTYVVATEQSPSERCLTSLSPARAWHYVLNVYHHNDLIFVANDVNDQHCIGIG